MKYVVISDIHGNLEALEAVIETFPPGDDMRILFAGDIVGYGADPSECMGRIKQLGAVCVMGNHDSAVSGRTDTSKFNVCAAKAAEWTANNLSGREIRDLYALPLVYEEEGITVAHGTLYKPEEFIYMMTGADAMHTFEVLRARICFVGHSHRPGAFTLRNGRVFQLDAGRIRLEKGAKYIINAGSVGQPRDGDPRACYCVYDPGRDEVEFFRIEYDIDKAARKIFDAGLPSVLGDRLFSGR